MSGEARRAASYRESTLEADNATRTIAKGAAEAEGPALVRLVRLEERVHFAEHGAWRPARERPAVHRRHRDHFLG